MQYIPCNCALLAQKTLFLTQKGTFLPKDLQKVRKSRKILIRIKIAYVRALNFRPSPNFLAGATRAPVQLLPLCIILWKHLNGILLYSWQLSTVVYIEY